MFIFKDFKARMTVALVLILSLSLLGMGRVASLTIKQNESYNQNKISIFLESGRGNFYYSNGTKITGNTRAYANIFLPEESAIKTYFASARGSEIVVGEKAFKNNRPAVLRRSEKIIGKGIFAVEIENRYENFSSMEHIIGYINGESNGVFSLEKGYEKVLKNENPIYADFFIDAKGEFLFGVYPTIRGKKNDNKIHLTVDSNIQKICEGEAQNFPKGAIVVSEIKTGKIRGIVSRPSFSPENISDYLESTESPFVNRALSCYNVGSVFKPLIAAAICENNESDFKETCLGVAQISGLNFHCYLRSGHGEMDLKNAISQSCNCFFYSAVNRVEPQKILNLASSLMFTSSIKLGSNIFSQRGTLPSAAELNNPATAANFSIGQGSVLLSPLAITNLYSAIANDGVYYTPTIIEGVTQDGKFTKENKGARNTVFTKSTAAELKNFLKNVVSFGTGTAALPLSGGAAGKTATAQTGKFTEKGEIINSWFCGFFPFKNPKYAVTVFLEDANDTQVSATEIFKNIADSIISLEE